MQYSWQQIVPIPLGVRLGSTHDFGPDLQTHSKFTMVFIWDDIRNDKERGRKTLVILAPHPSLLPPTNWHFPTPLVSEVQGSNPAGLTSWGGRGAQE